MLWLCISLPQLPLQALQADETDNAIAVTACEGSARWIICCNRAAGQANLKAAMNYTMALAIHPQIVMLERKPQAEQAALERLAGWAYQFSSQVILGPVSTELRLSRTSCLWLEIGASLSLFGGFRQFIEQVEAGLEQLRYAYRLGIAPTLEGAALLARADIRIAITQLPALYARIRPLPIGSLTLAPEIIRQLYTAGVRSIGLLLELPRDAVAKRFGPQTRHYLDRLTGVAADPRPAFHLPASYAAHFEFEFEVRSTESLLFPVRRMLREFAGYLRARDTGVQHFRLTFSHRQYPATELRIGLSVPERNADRFFALVREQLENTELAAAAIGMGLFATEFAMPTAMQPDLLNGALGQTEELSHTMDRLAARLGEDNVRKLKPMAEHRPETSWAYEAPSVLSPEYAGHTNLQFPERPLWLLPTPQPLELSAMPPMTSGPERIESGWWDDGDVQRDYYIERMNNGPDLWVFRDLRNSGWYLHGLWS
ncbi:MAG TPA: DNA polymerase Y family protein [Steroidobacteraceae bacterium]|jgi:protein ImuB